MRRSNRIAGEAQAAQHEAVVVFELDAFEQAFGLADRVVPAVKLDAATVGVLDRRGGRAGLRRLDAHGARLAPVVDPPGELRIGPPQRADVPQVDFVERKTSVLAAMPRHP